MIDSAEFIFLKLWLGSTQQQRWRVQQPLQQLLLLYRQKKCKYEM